MPFMNFLGNLVGSRGRRPYGSGPGAVKPVVLSTADFSQHRTEWIAVQSSNVSHIGYDFLARLMRIRFLNGAEYEYENIPQTLYEEFKAAPSKGRWVNQVLRPMSRSGQIHYRKVVEATGRKTGRRLFHYEPKEATQPGGYKASNGKPLPASSRLGRILANDKRNKRGPYGR